MRRSPRLPGRSPTCTRGPSPNPSHTQPLATPPMDTSSASSSMSMNSARKPAVNMVTMVALRGVPQEGSTRACRAECGDGEGETAWTVYEGIRIAVCAPCASWCEAYRF